MKIINVEPGGSTVFITDIGLRVGRDALFLRYDQAASSADLRNALDRGLVRLEIEDLEKGNPLVENLMHVAKMADAKREGEALFVRIESNMRGEGSITPDIPVREAVFEPVG